MGKMTFSLDTEADRVSEPELVIPVLEVLRDQAGGFMRTADLIKELEVRFNPKGKDAQIAKNRSDTYFSQKVRNLVSHKDLASSFIAQGLATHSKPRRGLTITDKGRAYLASRGH